MDFVLQPWNLLVVSLAGWMNRHQQNVIEYLRTDNRVLKEKIGNKRILLDDTSGAAWPSKARCWVERCWKKLALWSPQIPFCRWHRQLIAAKWDYSRLCRRPGRPPVSKELMELVLRIARENPTWGYDRLRGALANLGHQISDTTVGNIWKDHGVEPAPHRKRQSSWKTFLKAHWELLAAIDFTTIEVWTKDGLTTFYLLFVMELATRRVHLAGCTQNPGDSWMMQVARNLSDADEGFLRDKKYLLMDRDTKFSEAFRSILEPSGVQPVRLPPRSPNLSPHLERFMRSVKQECLERMIFLGERSLRNALREFLVHFHSDEIIRGSTTG